MIRTTSLLLALSATSFAAQVFMSGSGSNNHSSFRYETRVEPRIEGQKLTGFGGGGLWPSNTKFHRYLKDDATKRYLGYDLAVEKRPDGAFNVTLSPLSLSADQMKLSGWTQLPLALTGGPQVVRAGDSISLVLFTNPATGQKIVEYIFAGEGGKAPVRIPEGPPRDFTVDDVPLTVSGVSISLNGKQLQGSSGGMIAGEAVFFYLPGHGRIMMSLAPNQDLGFRRAGEVRGQKATIRLGGDTWTLDCNRPLAPGGGVYHLYVNAEPAWRPSNRADEYFLGSSTARAMVGNR